MKPSLFFAVRKGNQGHMNVVEVTTLKTTQWWGRDSAGEGTNGRVDDLVSRFNTRELADAAATAYGEAWRKATPEVTIREMDLTAARRAREEAAMAAISDLIAAGQPG
jgi:hypothetical protein